MDRPADRIRKLVVLGASGDTPEALSARAHARRQIQSLDTELLDTLAGQRQRLLEKLRAESKRLIYERANKKQTGELVTSAMLLLQHYERYDTLIAAVLLMRMDSGRQLTDAERQHLDGPLERKGWLYR